MRFRVCSENGYTLIEIVIVIVILGIIGAFTFQMVGAAVQAFKKSSARKDLSDQGRIALERMVRELRDGKEITDCSSDSITFKKAHPAQAADNIEEVKFELVGTNLKRVGDPNGNEGGPYEAVLASDVTSFQVGDAGGGGSVTVDAVSSGSTSGGSSITTSHTTSGSDRLMLVGVSINNDNSETVTSVTYNGDPLTLEGTETNSDDARIEIWSLLAPDIGTHSVVITLSAALAQEAVAGVVSFNGVDQTTPLGTFASAQADDSTPATVNIPSETGELVFGVVSAEYDAVTAGSGQTEHWNIGVPQTYGAGGTDTGASPNVTMSWDLVVDATIDNHWAIGGVSIKPSGSPGSTVCGAGAEAVTLDNVTSRYNSGTGNLAHSISSGSGNNRLLVVCYAQENDNTINSMTYNGVNMTKIHREAHYSGTYNVTEMWYMLDADMPSSAGTYDVSMSVTAGNGPGIVVLSFEGVAQQAPETYNASHYDDWASDRSITQISNVSEGSLIVSVASNGECCGYDGSVGGAGGAGIRQAEGEPASAGMGVSTDLSSAGGTFNVTEISSTGSTTRRATHIVSAFAHASSLASNPLVPLELTLSSSEGGSFSMRTKVYMRNVPEEE